jgi:HEAT repeat protein
MRRIAFGVAVAVVFVTCKKDPNSPAYWEAQLKKEKTRTTALVEIGDKLTTAEQKEWGSKLVVQVFDKDPSRAATALRKLGVAGPDVVAKLDAALRSRDPSVMPAAASAAMALNAKQTEPALAEILSSWKSNDPQKMRDVRVEVMRALAHFESKSAVPALSAVAMSEAATKVERYEALRALAKSGDARAIPALLQGLYLACSLDRCSGAARVGLVRLGDLALSAVMRVVDRKDPAIEKMAKEKKLDEGKGQITSVPFLVLGDLGTAATARKLADNFLEGDASFAKANAVTAIGYSGSQELAEAVQGAYDKPVLEVRTNVLHALARLGAKSSIDFLADVIRKNEDPNLLWHAGLALSLLGTDAQLPLVESTLRRAKAAIPKSKGYDLDVAKQTVTFYEQFAARLRAAKGCSNDACWAQKLKDANKEVRLKAARMLAFAKNKAQAEDALLGALADPENEVREEIAFALRKVGTKKSVSALRTRLAEDREKSKLRTSLFQYELVAARIEGRGP